MHHFICYAMKAWHTYDLLIWIVTYERQAKKNIDNYFAVFNEKRLACMTTLLVNIQRNNQ